MRQRGRRSIRSLTHRLLIAAPQSPNASGIPFAFRHLRDDRSVIFAA
ncbi:hypothetical protein RRSWK_01127 [Rhodopirellula sp. SWK7]|nr:hypothetical protein RRSWK_01127 [Rhodopirellula sp. SWK7]